MRIAILSHNDVRDDSRILKELRSLEQVYTDIVVFGIRTDRTGTTAPPPSVRSPFRLRTRIKNLEKRVLDDEQVYDPGPHRLETYRTVLRFATPALAVLSVISIVLAFFYISAVSAAITFAALGVVSQLSYRRVKRLLRKRTKRLVRERFREVRTQRAERALNPALVRMRTSYALADGVCEESERHGPFDVVHGHDLAGLEAGMILKKRLGCRLIWDAHELYEDVANASAEYSVAASVLIAEASAHVDELICINESMAAHYRKRYPRLPKAHVVMNATPRADVPPRDQRLRKALDIADAERVLLFHGGLAPSRGLEILARAAASFPDHWTLVFLGRGKLEPELREIASTVNRETGAQRIRFLPFVPQEELLLWASGADVGIAPYENVCLNHTFCTPNKLWEYPGAGIPIIAPDYPEIEPLVRGYDVGWLLPADFDEHSIVEVVSGITTEEIERKSANTKPFLDAMSWERFEPVLLSVYHRIGRTTNLAGHRTAMARPNVA